MAVDKERRKKKENLRSENLRSEHSLLLQPITNTMSSKVHDLSPAEGRNGSFLNGLIDDEKPKDVSMTQESNSQAQQLSSKKRRSSKSKVPGELRRSSSTPHMRNLALTNPGDLSPTSNKARNKLGYHRTSVACGKRFVNLPSLYLESLTRSEGHCRRRKIRCLLAADDPQQRCSNCIRLKKECNFYPVEHTPEAPPSTIATKDTISGQPLTPAITSPLGPSEKSSEFRTPYLGASSASQNASYGFHGDSEINSTQAPPQSASK